MGGWFGCVGGLCAGLATVSFVPTKSAAAVATACEAAAAATAATSANVAVTETFSVAGGRGVQGRVEGLGASKRARRRPNGSEHIRKFDKTCEKLAKMLQQNHGQRRLQRSAIKVMLVHSKTPVQTEIASLHHPCLLLARHTSGPPNRRRPPKMGTLIRHSRVPRPTAIWNLDLQVTKI